MIEMYSFFSNYRKLIETTIKDFLQNSKPFEIDQTMSDSTRAVGDGLQKYISTNFLKLFNNTIPIRCFNSKFNRRSMEDFSFEDDEKNYYAVDVKTHNLSTGFNMPNLISVERLTKFYRKNSNYFVLLIIEYECKLSQVNISKYYLEFSGVHFIPIEFFDWDCLTIGALGWGQIQIINSNKIMINENNNRKKWMLQLISKLLNEFYPNEKNKIQERIKYFAKEKIFWNNC